MITDSLAVVCDYLYDLMKAKRVALGMPTDVENVFYGDQEKIPTTPVICIEPDNKRRSFAGDRNRVMVEFRVGIVIYHSALTDPQGNRRDADELADLVEGVVHANPQFGTPYETGGNPLVIQSLVELNESGWTRKSNTPMRSSRLLVTATSKVMLPPNPPAP